MNTKMVEEIANAVLYEGYLLYPYRGSAIKNQKRWNFGVLYPRDFCEIWTMQTEVLAKVDPDAAVNVRVRFLHLIGDQAMEREVCLKSFNQTVRFTCAPLEGQEPLEGEVQIHTEEIATGLVKTCVRILNTTEFSGSDRDQALRRSCVSTHTILHIDAGEFVSLLEPPDEFRDFAAACENVGTWPVLVGDTGERDAMLSSPIILYDYPQIAPESPGALFDGTEIDEILSLRILTLTDEEKIEMGQDARAREILERTERMPPEQFMKLHGVLHGLRNAPEETS